MGVRYNRQWQGKSEPGAQRAYPLEAQTLGVLPDSDLLRALRDLPEDLKVAVYLADVQGYPYQEIAAMTGTSVAAVAARLHHARRRLTDRLAAVAAARGLAPTRG
jgi:RNA polymerase sigma-70 factor, ECF subfamily